MCPSWLDQSYLMSTFSWTSPEEQCSLLVAWTGSLMPLSQWRTLARSDDTRKMFTVHYQLKSTIATEHYTLQDSVHHTLTFSPSLFHPIPHYTLQGCVHHTLTFPIALFHPIHPLQGSIHTHPPSSFYPIHPHALIVPYLCNLHTWYVCKFVASC